MDALLPEQGGDERYSKILLKLLPQSSSIPLEVKGKTFFSRVVLFLFGDLFGIKKPYNFQKVAQQFRSTILDAEKTPRSDLKKIRDHYNGLVRYYASEHYDETQKEVKKQFLEENLLLQKPPVSQPRPPSVPKTPQRIQPPVSRPKPPSVPKPLSQPSLPKGVQSKEWIDPETGVVHKLAESVVLPLVGALENPTVLCADMKHPSKTDSGLIFLEKQGWMVRRVRGDGHCLFYSIASQLLEKNRLLALQENLADLRKKGLFEGLPFRPEALIASSLSSKKPIEEQLQNEQTCNSWVLLLRTMAVHCLQRKIDSGDRTLRNVADEIRAMPHVEETLSSVGFEDTRASDKEIVDQYKRRMVSMDRPVYGGTDEIVLLGDVLGLSIKYGNAEELSDPGQLNELRQAQEMGGVINDSGSLIDEIVLLYRGEHFDSLYYRKPS